MSEYTVRPFQPDDRAAYCDLFPAIMDIDHEDGWFDWKYRDNPYVDHVPIVVATQGEQLVGARSFFPLRLNVGGRETLALQPCDTLVRPDHRRRGLFIQMTKQGIARYEDGEPALFFNFPNSKTLRGNRKLGWQLIGEQHAYYRIADPRTVASASTDSISASIASTIGTPLVRGYYRFRDVSTSVPASVSVSRESSLPTDRLVASYRTSRPTGIHAVRDETFYQWRFDNPDWTYSAYVVDAGSAEPMTAIVGRSQYTELTMTKVTDIAPIPVTDRFSEAAALLERIVADYPGTDLFVVPDGVLPPEALSDRGFRRDDSPPLSYVGSRTHHVVRPLGDWIVNGLDIRNRENWTITFAEYDTS